MILYISENALENISPIKIDSIGLNKKYSSLKTDNITVIKLKALANQSGFTGYYNLRKDELIQKLEAHPGVNEQVLMPGLELPRNTTWSVNTSVILDEPILGDNNPVLQPTPKFIAKSMQKIKDFGKWLLDFIPPKPKVVVEALESFKNLMKICTTREKFHSNWRSQNLHWKILQYSIE